MKTKINHIIRSSAIDGPGNRMVLFFQGCQFNCMYCHNPHTIGLCNLCGLCVKNCPTKSLSIVDQKMVHNSQTCTKCDRCIASCPSNSSPFYKEFSVDELIHEILPIADFISGITVSGGEAMLQTEFLKLFFTSIRKHKELQHLSLFIDSNGGAAKKNYEELLPLVDGFMIDLKAICNDSHKSITGESNKAVLENLLFLNDQKKLYEMRTVLVPEYNTSKEEILKLKEIHALLHPSVRKVLIRMRTHGIRKQYSHLQEPTDEEINQILNILDNEKVILI